jgi:HlyD family secretion protein
MKKWITLIIVVVIVIALVMLFRQGVPVRIAEVKKGTVKAYLEERARTTLPRIYHMTMPLNGRIMPIALMPGTKVKKGEIVARMDDFNFKAALQESKAKLTAIQRQITLNKYNAIEETALKESNGWIKVMGDAVKASWKKAEASKAKNQFAQWYVNSTEKMKQAISEKEAYHAQMVAAQSLVDYEADMVIYSAMRTCDTIFKLAPVYIRQYLGRKELDRQILLAHLNEMQASLSQVERDLRQTIIKSPVNGLVLKRYVQNERVMPAGAKLLDIGDLDHLEVTADILSLYAPNVTAGNRVEIYGTAIGEKPINGKVIRIHPEGFTRISSLGVREQRVPVNISIDKVELAKLHKQKRFLGVGFRVQVKIITGESKNVLAIPRTALFRTQSGAWRVFKIVKGKAAETEVQVGITNDTQAEILSGLKAGDKVIIAPDASIKNGTKVKK